MTRRRRGPRDMNAIRRAHNILYSRDFLSLQYHRERNLRENLIVIALAGPKATGKTSLSNDLARHLAARPDCKVLSTRSSVDADESTIEARRNAIRRQERGDAIRWYEVVEALNQEARSAYRIKVIPFLESSNDRKLKVVLLNRGLPDTLARQVLHSGVSLEAIAKELRGEPHKEPGYIRADLTILTVVNGREAYQRVLHRGREDEVEPAEYDSTERAVKLPPTFTDDIDRLSAMYGRIAGYRKTERDDELGVYTFDQKVLPGRVVVYDTSSAISYIGDRIAVDNLINAAKDSLLRRVLEEEINPLIEQSLGNPRRRASR